MSVRQFRIFCALDNASKELLKTAIERFNLSAHPYNRILKISRKMADLEYSENKKVNHISEAIQYRSLDRDCWLG